MNINSVYIANIYMLVDSELQGDLQTGSFKTTSIYLKATAVYHKNGNWYDLKTKEKYEEKVYGLEDIGTKFINFKEMIPFGNVINCNKENMSRRKILKKYNDLEKKGNSKDEYK